MRFCSCSIRLICRATRILLGERMIACQIAVLPLEMRCHRTHIFNQWVLELRSSLITDRLECPDMVPAQVSVMHRLIFFGVPLSSEAAVSHSKE
jgi:hypothetical protein